MEEGILKKVMSSVKCGSCGHYFEAHNVEVLGNSDEMWFLQAICSACHTQSLVVAIIQRCEEPDTAVDLAEEEGADCAEADVVAADDVLQMHEFLKDFDGDFSAFFGGASAS